MAPGPLRGRRPRRHPGHFRVIRWALLGAFLLAAAIPPAAAQTPLAEPGKPGWTPAGNTCFVWNRAPAEGETATWSGPCVAQRASGKGMLVWQAGDEQQTYEGEMRDGRLNGRGTYTFSLNSRYDGDFKDDDFDGKGTRTQPGIRYEGQWRAGKKHGRGTLTTMNGDRYEGEFRDDALTGRGILRLSDGRKYEGTLLDGRPNGQGTLTDAVGSVTGVWKDGCFRDGAKTVTLGADPATCQ